MEVIDIKKSFKLFNRQYNIETSFKSDLQDIGKSFIQFIDSVIFLLYNNVLSPLMELFTPKFIIYLIFKNRIKDNYASKDYNEQVTQILFNQGKLNKKQFEKLKVQIDAKSINTKSPKWDDIF